MEWKTIDQITRKEWIKFKWAEVQSAFGDGEGERTFRVVSRRTPDEAYQAMEEWDMTAAERDAELGEEINSEE